VTNSSSQDLSHFINVLYQNNILYKNYDTTSFAMRGGHIEMRFAKRKAFNLNGKRDFSAHASSFWLAK
jgi:hypothetical protein